MGNPALRRFFPAAVFLYMAGLYGFLHMQAGGLAERAGYFHARFAGMLPELGLARSFAWIQAGALGERFFDPAFLYHALLAPFARGAEPLGGFLLGSTLLSASLFPLLHGFLARQRVPAPWVPTLLLACLGSPFLLRLWFTDSHVLASLLLVAGLAPLIEERWRWALAFGVLWSWSRAFVFVYPAVALIFAAARWSGGEATDEEGGRLPRAFDWRSPAAAAAGLAAGLLLHPQSPAGLTALASQAGAAFESFRAGSVAAVAASGDWVTPYSPRGIWHVYPLVTALVLSGGFACWQEKGGLRSETLGLLAAAGFGLVMTLGTQSGIEYAAPLTAAAFGLLWRDSLWGLAGPLRAWAEAGRRRRVLAGIFAAAVLAQAAVLAPLLPQIRGLRPPRFRGAAAWLAANLAPGETAANLWWSDFPELFYDGRSQRYLAGLEPFYGRGPADSAGARLERMRSGMDPIDPSWLSRTFGARFLVLRAGYVKHYPQLAGWRSVYRDTAAAVYELPALP